MSFTDAIIPTNTCYLHAETESVVHLKRQILAIEVINENWREPMLETNKTPYQFDMSFPKDSQGDVSHV